MEARRGALQVSIRPLPEQRELAPPSELALSARKCGSRIKKTVFGDVLLPMLDVAPEDSWLGPAFSFGGPSGPEPGSADFSQVSPESDLSSFLPEDSSRQALYKAATSSFTRPDFDGDRAAPLQGTKLAGKSLKADEPIRMWRHAWKLGTDAMKPQEHSAVHAKNGQQKHFADTTPRQINSLRTSRLHSGHKQQSSRQSPRQRPSPVEATASTPRPHAHQDNLNKKDKIAARNSRPQSARQSVDIKRMPDENLSSKALIYARRFKIDINEVIWVLRSLQAAETCVTTGRMQAAEFERFLLRALDIRHIEENLVNQAYDACQASSGPLDLNGFFAWLVGNMITVSRLTSAPEKQMSIDLVETAASRNDFSPVALDDVKAKFDKYDGDKSGEIEADEFEALMRDVFNIDQHLLVPPERLQRLWKELDRDGNGSVDFIEFADWYCKYFNGVEWKDPLSAFYDSYMPLPKNKNSVLDPKAKPLAASIQRRNPTPSFLQKDCPLNEGVNISPQKRNALMKPIQSIFQANPGPGLRPRKKAIFQLQVDLAELDPTDSD